MGTQIAQSGTISSSGQTSRGSMQQSVVATDSDACMSTGPRDSQTRKQASIRAKTARQLSALFPSHTGAARARWHRSVGACVRLSRTFRILCPWLLRSLNQHESVNFCTCGAVFALLGTVCGADD